MTSTGGRECDRCSYERSGRAHVENELREIHEALNGRGLTWVSSSRVGVPGTLTTTPIAEALVSAARIDVDLLLTLIPGSRAIANLSERSRDMWCPECRQKIGEINPHDFTHNGEARIQAYNAAHNRVVHDHLLESTEPHPFLHEMMDGDQA